MKKYELMIVTRVDLGAEKIEEDLAKIKALIVRHKGQITEEIKWGKKQLAYLVKKQYEGYYTILNLELEPAAVTEIKREFRLMQGDILRFVLSCKVEKRKRKKKEAASVA